MSTIASVNIVFLVLDLLLVIGFVFALMQAWHFRPKFTLFNKPSRKILTLRDAVLKERWQQIGGKLAGGSAESLKLAVIEADKMADDVLKRLGYTGQHMADRLAQMNQEDFRTLKRLWDAHRFRNNLVHTPSFEFTREKISKVVNDYRDFFKEVGIL